MNKKRVLIGSTLATLVMSSGFYLHKKKKKKKFRQAGEKIAFYLQNTYKGIKKVEVGEFIYYKCTGMWNVTVIINNRHLLGLDLSDFEHLNDLGWTHGDKFDLIKKKNDFSKMAMPKSKVNDYKYLAKKTYDIDIKKPKRDPGNKVTVGKIIGSKLSSCDYQILEVEHNQQNGMQALLAAPIVNGKSDSSELVIAYAGTDITDGKDLQTALFLIWQGHDYLIDYQGHEKTEKIEGQAITAKRFADTVKDKYPESRISTTGHSLGEFLGMYVAAENKWQNIGFNGPDAYKIMSEKARNWLARHPDKIINYRNKWDVLGNFGGNKTKAGILCNMGSNIINAHELNSWDFTKKEP